MSKKSVKEVVLNVILDILIFLLGFVLIVFIYNNIEVKVLGNDHASFFGYSLFEVQTGSMKNEINIGDWIIVKYTDDISLNDVVTYKKGKNFITHRVVEAYKNTYVTKGDANNTKDDAISKKQIVGKVVKVLPHFGFVKKTLFNPFIIILLLLIVYVANLNSNDNKINKLIDKVSPNRKDFIKKIKDKLSDIFSNIKTKEDKKPIKEEIIKELKVDNKKEIDEEDKAVDSLNLEVDTRPNPEDLDKTMFFRMVNVDETELDNTYLKIAETSIDDNKESVKKVALEDKKDEEDDASIIESNLEMLNERKKKFNSILEKAIYIKKLELDEIIGILDTDKKLKVNEATIKESLLNSYIDGKYYNYSGDVNTMYNGRNAIKKTKDIMKEEAINLIKKYKGTDLKYGLKVEKYLSIFNVIISLDHYSLVDMDIKAKRELYKSEILKYIKNYSEVEDILINVNRIIRLQKIHTGMIKQSLEKLETGMFELNVKGITSKKDLYGINLEHNITFSKAYSDYIVDKTYSEGVIAEDKIIILVSLLLSKLVKNMFSFNFKDKYIIYLPNTLYEKENKLNKIIEKLNDEFVKNSIIILVRENEFRENKKIIKKLMKIGFKFAISLEEEKSLNEKEKKDLYLVKYIFVGLKKNVSSVIYDSIPEELLERVVFDDILNKTGNYVGGE